MAGSTGVLPPPAGYLNRLREICDKYGILLIFDEVITGFGRLGAPFAAERYGVVPDMITSRMTWTAAFRSRAFVVREGIPRPSADEHAIELLTATSAIRLLAPRRWRAWTCTATSGSSNAPRRWSPDGATRS